MPRYAGITQGGMITPRKTQAQSRHDDWAHLMWEVRNIHNRNFFAHFEEPEEEKEEESKDENRCESTEPPVRGWFDPGERERWASACLEAHRQARHCARFPGPAYVYEEPEFACSRAEVVANIGWSSAGDKIPEVLHSLIAEYTSSMFILTTTKLVLEWSRDEVFAYVNWSSAGESFPDVVTSLVAEYTSDESVKTTTQLDFSVSHKVWYREFINRRFGANLTPLRRLLS